MQDERVNCAKGTTSINPRKLSIPEPLKALAKACRPHLSIPAIVIFLCSRLNAYPAIREESSIIVKTATIKRIRIITRTVNGFSKNFFRLEAER